MIREAELFVMAEQVLVEVVGRIRTAAGWDVVLPSLFDIPGFDEPPSVRHAVERYAREEAWVPDLLAGATMDEIGCDKFDGELLGDDPHGNLRRLADAGIAAAEQVTDGEKVVHAEHGNVSARDYLWRLVFLRTFTAHDIAFGLGTTACPLTEEFARPAYELTEPKSWRWRSLGYFRTPLPEPDRHNSWRDRFLLMAGRDPHPGHHD